jgi:hypothetical protein
VERIGEEAGRGKQKMNEEVFKMKKIINIISPFLFLGIILTSMNTFKHVDTLTVVEEATIKEYLQQFTAKEEIESENSQSVSINDNE